MLGGHRLTPLAEESGFSLVELLVAMLGGLVVAGALFAILQVSLHQSARITDVAEATQLGRTTMTRVVDELHSACIAQGFNPVQEKSKGNELLFITAYGKEAQLSGAQKHKIVWSGEGGTLTDYSTPSSGGTSPEFTFASEPSPPGGIIIGHHIYRAEVERSGKFEKVPIFQYYNYGSEATSSSTTGLSTLNLLTVPEATGLSLENAEATSAVQVSFKEAPFDNNTKLSRASEYSQQVNFSFSVPAAESTIKDAPCE